jgi:hypothetical protein
MELWDVLQNTGAGPWDSWDSRGRDFSHGIVKFVPDGLQLHNLNGKEESQLSELRGESLGPEKWGEQKKNDMGHKTSHFGHKGEIDGMIIYDYGISMR